MDFEVVAGSGEEIAACCSSGPAKLLCGVGAAMTADRSLLREKHETTSACPSVQEQAGAGCPLSRRTVRRTMAEAAREITRTDAGNAGNADNAVEGSSSERAGQLPSKSQTSRRFFRGSAVCVGKNGRGQGGAQAGAREGHRERDPIWETGA